MKCSLLFFIALICYTQCLFSQTALPIGYLDAVSNTGGGGWAYDPDDVNTSINVHIYINGRFHTSISASTFRSDLAFTNKNHGYNFTMPTWYNPAIANEITVYAINYPSGANPVLTNCPWRTGTPNGNQSISKVAGTSTIVVTTGAKYAGAIYSLKWKGKEFINTYDHGRQLQTASSFNYLGECYNPTEAGSEQDGVGATTSSFLQYILKPASNRLITQVLPAFWGTPGINVPSCGMPNNTTVRSNHYIKKDVTIGMPGMPHVIKYITTFDIPDNFTAAQLELVTGYLTSDFTKCYTYEHSSQTISALSYTPAGEQAKPVILATASGAYAMGILSPSVLDPAWGFGQPYGSGYGRFQFPSNSTITPLSKNPGCVKWNAVVRKTNLLAGVYTFTNYVIVGSLANVKTSMTQLCNYLGINPIANNNLDNQNSLKATDIYEVDNNANFFICYPNPIQDELTIQLTETNNNSSFQLYNLQGQMMQESIIDNRITINTKSLNCGVYLVKLEAKNKTYYKKIIKTN